MKIKLLILFCALSFGACNSSRQAKTSDRVLYVAPFTKPCSAGVMQKDCLLVKWETTSGEWSFFYDDIEGFDYQKGYQYKLLVHEEPVENPPADASSIHYTLVKILSKNLAEKH